MKPVWRRLVLRTQMAMDKQLAYHYLKHTPTVTAVYLKPKCWQSQQQVLPGLVLINAHTDNRCICAIKSHSHKLIAKLLFSSEQKCKY